MLIVTHPGKAHRDEFLSICLLMAHGGFFSSQVTIERREPTAFELGTSMVIVLDIGGIYDPEFNNFDHHQLEPADGICTLSQICLFLGLTNSTFLPWLLPSTIMDTQGPGALAKHWGLDSMPAGGASPIETAMLDYFQTVKVLEAKTNPSFLDTMHEIGHQILLKYKKLDTDFRELQVLGSEIGQMADTGILMTERYFEPLAVAAVCEDIGIDEPTIRIFPANRPNAIGEFGWTIVRDDDLALALDLHTLADEKEICFAHKGGFIAQTHHKLEPIYVINGLLEKARQLTLLKHAGLPANALDGLTPVSA